MTPISSNAPADPPMTTGGVIIRVAVGAVLLLVVGANALRSNQMAVAQLADQADFAAHEKNMDDYFRPFAALGNIWLGYDNFAIDQLPENARMDERWLMLKWYTRATYTLYPKRVYVADADTVVPVGFSGNPIPPFAPTPAWLAEHQVKSHLILRRTAGDLALIYNKL
jgi:hypothetical protein